MLIQETFLNATEGYLFGVREVWVTLFDKYERRTIVESEPHVLN